MDAERLKNLKMVYGFALTLIAVVILSSSVIMHYAISRNAGDSRIINLSGRQRMLSQRLTKDVLALERIPTLKQWNVLKGEMSASYTDWKAAHRGLQFGDRTLGLPARENSAEIKKLFAEIEPYRTAMVSALDRMLGRLERNEIDAVTLHAAAEVMLTNEPRFLLLMDKITFMFDREAKERIGSLQRIEKYILAVGLLVLLFEFFYIFRPSLFHLSVMIDSLKCSTDKLKESMQYVDTIIGSMSDTLIVLSPEGVIMQANKAACSLLGCAEEELIGRPFEALLEGSALDKYRAEKTSGANSIAHDEITYITKDGRSVPVLFTASEMRSSDGILLGMVCAATDITERKRLEEQLYQSQKMEAIGQLAGGVAHEFNNILTAVIGCGSFLRRNIPEADSSHAYVDLVMSASERAATLTHSLLAFSRKQIIAPKPFDLNDIVLDFRKIMERIIGEDIELKISIEHEGLTAKVDKGQIEQILLNLVTNARDAMPQGGMLSIRTQKGYYGDDDGDYAVISVADTGIGMDEKTKAQVFEPFFTTKDVGKGTGLGLSMVYGMIKQHDGFINVYSEPGMGTTFKIYLPLVKSVVESGVPQDMSPLPGGHETILLVEDDVHVRNVVRTALVIYGYNVLEATDGVDAVKVFHENEDAIQLIISDVIMPKRSGKEMYDEIRKVRQGMKVLFMSGYAADVIAVRGFIEDGMNFISKPVKPDELLRRIRIILDR